MNNQAHIIAMKNRIPYPRQIFQTVFFFFFLSLCFQGIAQKKVLSQSLKALVRDDSKQGLLHFKNVPGLNVSNIFTAYKDVFGLGANDKLLNYKAETDNLGITTYHFQQYYKNYPLEYNTVIVDEKEGHLKSMIGTCVNSINVNTTPLITESAALQLALHEVPAHTYYWQIPDNEVYIKQQTGDSLATFYPKAKMVIINDNFQENSGNFHFCYKFNIKSADPILDRLVYVDSRTGAIIYNISTLCMADFPGTAITVNSGSPQIFTQQVTSGPGSPYYTLKESGRGGGIFTYDMRGINNVLNAIDFRDDNNIWGEPGEGSWVSDIHWALEMTFDYFLAKHARIGWNTNGPPLPIKCYYRNFNPPNGYFDPALDAIFLATAIGIYFPWVSLDMIGHEYTHGITKFAANLPYIGETGAINESFSDIFATDIEFNTPGKMGNYTLFDEIYIDPTYYMRNMKDPALGSPVQPDTYQGDRWRNTADISSNNDFGGVHINSGIMNKWFYLLSEGGSGKNDKKDRYFVEGIGRDKASKIAYRALTAKIVANAQYQQARDATIEACDLFGMDCTQEKISVINAWYAVGVGGPVIQIDSVVINKSTCNVSNGKIWVRAKGVGPDPPQYEWSTGATTQQIEFLAPGNYTVTITDPNTGCKIDSTITVEDKINFTLNLYKTDISQCGKDDGFAWIRFTNIVGNPDVLWSTGAVNYVQGDLHPGWYWVRVIDTNSRCEKKDSFELKQPGVKVKIWGGGVRTYCDGKEQPSEPLIAGANVSPIGIDYHWSTGDKTRMIDVDKDGTYSVTVTSAGGCYGWESTKVTYWKKDCNDAAGWDIPVVKPQDPNEITGPPGYGSSRYISKSLNQPYTVHFENSPDFATAPALKVTVDVPFDPKVDMFSLRLGDFGFGNFNFSPPANSPIYNKRLDIRDSLGIFVDVTAGIDVEQHKAFWILQAIDPLTGVEPSDPTKGFLLVNDSVTHKGEGYVAFTQKAKNTAVTGDTIHARASIVFDVNSPLETNTWTNVVDAVAPVSQVSPLPANIDSANINITITGSDDMGGSGLKLFSLYVATGSGPFSKYGDFSPGTSINYTGTLGNTYKFFSLATDNVGNVEAMKTSAETSIQLLLYHPVIQGTLRYSNAASTPMNNVRLRLKNYMGTISDSTITDINGYYELHPPQAGKYIIQATTVKPWGGVNAIDALQVLRYFTGIDTLSAIRIKAADVNTSGNVNAVDALLISKRFVGIIQDFNAGDWYFEHDSIAFESSNITLDFKGICVGDVNGSYLPPNIKVEPSVSLLRQDELKVNPGETILLPIKMKEVVKLGSISLVLNYPAELIEVLDVTAGGDTHGNITYSAKNGYLRIAWYDLNPMTTETENTILNLKLKAKNLSSTMYVSFGLDEESIISSEQNKVISPVSLLIPNLKIDIPQSYRLLSNRPNPFSSQTEIEYSLPEAGQVTFSILNSLGEQIEILQNEHKTEGSYKILFDGSKLREGVYYGKIDVIGKTSNYVQAIKMVLIRK